MTEKGNETSDYMRHFNYPANVALVPGVVLPYDLNVGDVQEPFDPITTFAARESGKFGPLNEEKLKAFLRQYLDTGIVHIRDVVQKYTDNVVGLKEQLTNLRYRINQIRTSEKERNAFLKKRLKDMEKALMERKAMPVYLPHQLFLSKAAREAFQYIQGPLTESELLYFIYNGEYNSEIPAEILVRQLKDLRLCIYENEDTENTNFKFRYEKISITIDNIIRQFLEFGIL